MNKEEALRRFLGRVRDKARRTDLDFVFDPPRVLGLVSGPSRDKTEARLKWNPRIWNGRPWMWTDWGDFEHFEILRGDGSDFPADRAIVVGTTKEPFFDSETLDAGSVYYRVRAVNVKGVAGPVSDTVAVEPPRAIKRRDAGPEGSSPSFR